MTGQYSEDSDETDFEWVIEEKLSRDHEAQLEIGGYKYPIDKYDNYDLTLVFTHGKRWEQYTTLHLCCMGSDDTPENMKNDLDKLIEMLQAGRDKFAELMIEFPSESWSPDNG